MLIVIDIVTVHFPYSALIQCYETGIGLQERADQGYLTIPKKVLPKSFESASKVLLSGLGNFVGTLQGGRVGCG